MLKMILTDDSLKPALSVFSLENLRPDLASGNYQLAARSSGFGSRAKDRRAHPHHRTAAGDGGLQVGGHAH